MLFVCREAAGSEQAAGEAGIQQDSTSGVQSCQEPVIFQGGAGCIRLYIESGGRSPLTM